jgi:uncharacterized protein YqeY
MTETSSPLKERLRTDLTTAMKERDKLRSNTIRMVLTAISQAEVAGSQAVTLSEAQVLDVVVREARKRREAEEAYVAAGRAELADKERAEAHVLADYLPARMTPAELEVLVSDTIARTGAAELGPKGMGKVMNLLTPQTKGRVDGAAVAAEVRRQLG